MAVMNPPIGVQSRSDNNADDLRAALTAGMMGQGVGQNPRPRQGIIPGLGKELSVAANGTPNMTVIVGSGGIIIPAPQNGHGGWYVANDGDLSLSIAAANATNPRTDLVIARVADPTYSAGGNGLADIKVITGTAGVGAPVPTVPTSEGVYQVLAQVAVAANATSIAGANITLNTATVRPYTTSIGGVLTVANAAARTGLPAQANGQQVWQIDTGQLWLWTGIAWAVVSEVGAWTPWTPTWLAGGVGGPSLGNGTLNAAYRWLAAKALQVRLALTLGSTTGGGTGTWSFSLPSGVTTANVEQVGHAKMFSSSSGKVFNGLVVIPAAAALLYPYMPASPTLVNLLQMQSSATAVPEAIGVGSNLVLSATIETQ